MAVALWSVWDGSTAIKRNFHPPKRASLKHWWMAVRKVVPSMPLYEDRGTETLQDVSEEVIMLEGVRGGRQWRLTIARKRHMK